MNQKGQVAVEFILLSLVVLGLTIGISKSIRDSQFLTQMISGPWSHVQGMVENGTWGSIQKTHGEHPNYLWRHISLVGDRDE